ncbi:hypothetical protein GCM10010300_79070 [Streptomyces olivaceoviridis]|nr:hypothetical protein GCM10010300_79070 [Streptomyces olivaceoviridis]
MRYVVKSTKQSTCPPRTARTRWNAGSEGRLALDGAGREPGRIEHLQARWPAGRGPVDHRRNAARPTAGRDVSVSLRRVPECRPDRKGGGIPATTWHVPASLQPAAATSGSPSSR